MVMEMLILFLWVSHLSILAPKVPLEKVLQVMHMTLREATQ